MSGGASVYRIESAPGPAPREDEWRSSGNFIDSAESALVELRARVGWNGLRLSYRLMRGETQVVRISPPEMSS